MAKCAGCNPTSVDCIEFNTELNIKYKDFADLIVKMDKSLADINTLLTKQIDKKSLKDNHTYVIDYIQDLINKFEVINSDLSKTKSITSTKLQINSELVQGEKSIAQLFEIILKELEGLKKRSNVINSDLYLQNNV